MLNTSYVQSQVPKSPPGIRFRLESKPVSYPWFPSQVGPQVRNPGYSTRADRLANVVAI
jgi:hypothetical protein